MEKLKESGNNIEEFILETLLWFLSAVLLLFGWQLLGIPFLISLCASTILAFIACCCEDIDCKPTDFLGCALNMGVSAVVSAFAENLWIGLLVFICIAVVDVIREHETIYIHVCNIILIIFIFMFASVEKYDNYIQDKGNAEPHLEAIQNTAKLSQELKNQIADNPFLLLREDNPVTKQIKQKEADMQRLLLETDSMVNAMRQKKASELAEVRNQYREKSQILRIKKLWLNSDTRPWTYSSWKRIEYESSTRGYIYKGGSSHFTGSVKPSIYGKSTYIGENKLDYVNVVFSDNCYQRYLIKDSPEWLLVKEGQQVKLCYDEAEDFSEKDISFTNVTTNAFDFVFTKQYVPLFK